MATVAVTGALGNLGTKLARHLVRVPEVARVACIDAREPDSAHTAAMAAAGKGHADVVWWSGGDLRDAGDERWRGGLVDADAVVHFAAQNPYPEASWADAAASMDINANVVGACTAPGSRVRRLVFATSNHVCGRYKDAPRADSLAPGGLHPGLEPAVGTVWHTGEQGMDSTPYATAKLAGERMARAAATAPGSPLTAVCVRIGWCQPGDNSPTTLSAAGTPTVSRGDADDASADADAADELARADLWFRRMWLSNRDFQAVFERALLADASAWPSPCIVVNGMSDNTAMVWSLVEGRELLGYEPKDDVTRAGRGRNSQ